MLRGLFSSSFSDIYLFSVQSLEFKMDMLEAFVIMQCINMLQGLIPPKVNGLNVLSAVSHFSGELFHYLFIL